MAQPAKRQKLTFVAMNNAALDDTTLRYIANTSHPFFRLPVEIRTVIYELVTTMEATRKRLRGGAVLVNGTREPWEPAIPGLLAVCRQVRQEALPVYLTSNVFRIWIYYSARAATAFEKRCIALGVASKMKVEFISFYKMDLTQLLIWTKHIHSGSGLWEPATESKFNSSALAIARECRGMVWSKVKKIIEAAAGPFYTNPYEDSDSSDYM